jgi:hypothetical protein
MGFPEFALGSPQYVLNIVRSHRARAGYFAPAPAAKLDAWRN